MEKKDQGIAIVCTIIIMEILPLAQTTKHETSLGSSHSNSNIILAQPK